MWRHTIGWLREHSHYWGVIAAIFAFASWLISSTLSDWAKDQSDIASRLQQQQDEFGRYRVEWLWRQNVDRTLMRIESRLLPPPGVTVSAEGQMLIHALTELDLFRIFTNDAEGLLEAVRELATAAAYSGDDDLLADIAALEKDVQANHASLATLQKKVNADVVGNGVSPPQLTDLEAKQKLDLIGDLKSQVSDDAAKTLPLMDRYSAVSAKAERSTAQLQRKYKSLAATLKWIAIALFIAATTFEIASRIQDSNKSKDKNSLRQSRPLRHYSPRYCSRLVFHPRAGR